MPRSLQRMSSPQKPCKLRLVRMLQEATACSGLWRRRWAHRPIPAACLDKDYYLLPYLSTSPYIATPRWTGRPGADAIRAQPTNHRGGLYSMQTCRTRQVVLRCHDTASRCSSSSKPHARTQSVADTGPCARYALASLCARLCNLLGGLFPVADRPGRRTRGP